MHAFANLLFPTVQSQPIYSTNSEQYDPPYPELFPVSQTSQWSAVGDNSTNWLRIGLVVGCSGFVLVWVGVPLIYYLSTRSSKSNESQNPALKITGDSSRYLMQGDMDYSLPSGFQDTSTMTSQDGENTPLSSGQPGQDRRPTLIIRTQPEASGTLVSSLLSWIVSGEEPAAQDTQY